MKTEGLIAATFGTFKEDGSLNLSVVPALVDKLISEGISGVFVCGTNGEGPNLTVEERMKVAEAYIAAADKRVKVWVHVGHTSIAESRKLAAHAASAGADAISSVAAFYFKPANVQQLVSSMAMIAAAAPSLPFYYYHLPVLTGVAMDMVEFLRLGEEAIPNLAGIKYTAHTQHEFQACLNYKDGKFDVLYGYDEMLLGALMVGAKGAIGSTYTFAAPLYLRMMEAFKAGRLEEARDLQLQSVEMIRRFVKYSPIPAQRAITKMLGYDLGSCRLPLVSLTDKEYGHLKDMLDEMQFFEKLKKCSLINPQPAVH
ncbi:MAG: dihydrodipicolinate synthase family protein [Pseudobacter sp.]|uniref:dihydrodipicolinate synthase family protein n=1 Tax=Pseudobacter sp. TaxID=2045420 RepID=UPI003F7CF5DD